MSYTSYLSYLSNFRIGRRLGVDQFWRRYENRRQSGIPVPFIIQAAQVAISAFQQIPVDKMIQ